MKVSELLDLLGKIHAENEGMDLEIRIGDQIEAGAYLHGPVGGVYQGTNGEIILCSSDDATWLEEPVTDENLPVLWPKSNG